MVFLLVPALTILTGLPIQAAIGTSLFIIVLQSAAALAGHANQVSIDIPLNVIITSCTIAGSFAGFSLSGKISAYYLQKGFGVLYYSWVVFTIQRVNSTIDYPGRATHY